MFTLVIMAAGLGSRFGGTKQLVQVGPNGETFLDFAIADAHAAGACKAVLIVRSDIEADVIRHLESRDSLPVGLDIAYVRQNEHGPPRPKPWGTAHAVLSAAEAVIGPFMVCNADDYYGPTAYTTLAQAMKKMAESEAWLCGYRLNHTLPVKGTVTRGICKVDGDQLTAIVEQEGISQADHIFSADTLVSMNLWAFSSTFFDVLRDGFTRFLAQHSDDTTAEYLLPHAVAAEMKSGALTVKVATTEENWIGVTNPDDLLVARAALKSR
ncbi:MAG: NTP transferase domain-containing protein [Acidimicrobiia bacterium]|nr:NTP transferase domain-containing protein [Acidimicrobiia bacterium]MYC57048.1 NTP transferase domain-containing protein [Acidimicrobiia bacterium]MYI30125.1 NTP transferase domain-containing protein [Acidimicrobiia bacterium]